MHVSTHNDRIWQAGCQQKEDAISSILTSNGVEHLLVDAIKCHPHELDKNFATDNQFRVNTNYKNLAPEFWHIYRCPQIEEFIAPNYNYNVLMNRVSGERLMLLFMLHDANLFDGELIGFNCLYHDMDPTVEQRQENFSKVHNECGWHHWDNLHSALKPNMPMLLDMDPDTAAMHSQITLVVESYVNDTVIAFSEKIFRALQTPRPWLLFCSPDSVSTLRNAGFDVLDDVVDHSYDSVVNVEKRIQMLLEQLKNFSRFSEPRYKQAVQTNQAVLDQLKLQWSYKLQSILEQTQS